MVGADFFAVATVCHGGVDGVAVLQAIQAAAGLGRGEQIGGGQCQTGEAKRIGGVGFLS